MYNHVSPDYLCPICLTAQGIENEHTMTSQQDIFYRDDLVIGFISAKFVTGNEGHPLVVPIKHYENFYDLPPEVSHRIMDVAQRIAIALKQVRNCDGVTLRQNNEPAGDQHAFHYHLHIFPRFTGDHFNEETMQARVSDPAERVPYAEDLRKAFSI
jgi:histidine triad (HIT) family protein